ncbi:MAG: M48 family metalloprotease [Myxococcales bacterium]|nr:M48 family metalloprotease [Myxococcales bacterium]
MTRPTLAALVLLGCGASSPPAASCSEELRGARAARCVGELAERVVVAAFGVYEDDALSDYVRSVGERVAAASDRPGVDYRFLILDSPDPQAWAVPDRRVFVTRGLLAVLDSEAELAAVLAHEIGHHSAGHLDHLADDLAAQDWGDPVGLTLAHSRDRERQADQLSVLFLHRAGYDVRAVSSMLRALHRSADEAQRGWARRHPPLSVRLARVERAIDRRGGGDLHAERYLRHVDGMIVGVGPRSGDARGENARASVTDEVCTASECPRRLRIRRLVAPASLAELEGCAMNEERALLAMINAAQADVRLAAGSIVKCIGH